MFKPKSEPIIKADAKLTNEIYIEDGVLYLNSEEYCFKFDYEWHIKLSNGNYVSLGSNAIPSFVIDEKFDHEYFDDLFDEINE